jgi:DNA replicative helicase MCM subunit Mcm2 (Cdc46/Mcm family)
MRLMLVACHVSKVHKGLNVHRELSVDSLERQFEQFWANRQCDPVAARNEIVRSVCPQLCSVFDPKLALMLVLLGGVAVEREGSTSRACSHVLLVGDPGVGKSQLIRFAAKLASRCACLPPACPLPAALSLLRVYMLLPWVL